MNHDKKDGFTLIELMLAMTFIAMLLVAIALTTIQISNIYTKGITLREVNQAGRSLSDELQRTIASATPFDVTPKGPGTNASASRYIVHAAGGRLCLGSHTYAWNFGKSIEEGTIFNKYAGTGTNDIPIRFIRVVDPNGQLCTTPSMPAIDRDDATDLLSSGDRDLVLHKFSINQTKVDASTNQAIYVISMRIGTNDRDQLTTDDNTSCKPPSDGEGDESYCSVNQFDIIARAGNKTGGQ